MKILVFDDSVIHRKAAQVQLRGHDVTIVGTYDEAERLLTPQVDYKKESTIVEAQFGDFNPYRSNDEAKRAEYFAAREVAQKQATTYPDFDVVLTDLLVPASEKAQGPEGQWLVGTEMPLGTVIALRALAVGVKMVAVVTDMNHHNHPASAAFDGFPMFSLGDVKVLCANNNVTELVDADTLERISWTFLETPEGQQKYPKQENHPYRQKLVYVKAWNRVLSKLLGKQDEDDES